MTKFLRFSSYGQSSVKHMINFRYLATIYLDIEMVK